MGWSMARARGGGGGEQSGVEGLLHGQLQRGQVFGGQEVGVGAHKLQLRVVGLLGLGAH